MKPPGRVVVPPACPNGANRKLSQKTSSDCIGNSQCGVIHEALTNKEEAFDRYKFVEIDYGKIIEGFGAWYKRVSDPEQIAGTISEALSCGRPAVVECVSSSTCHPFGVNECYHDNIF